MPRTSPEDPANAAGVTGLPPRDQTGDGRVSPLVTASDADLVLRARDGDRGAFAALVGRYRDRFLRYARHMLADQEDAEEAVQDTLVRAYRALDRCEPQRFGAWAHRILVNRCRTRAVRGHWFRRRRVDLQLAHDVGTMDEDVLWRDEINRALSVLPVDQREAFLLKHVDDMTYEDMSSMTGASVPALKMRVSRACDRLRTILESRQ